ncbi:hypothetical protein [Roseivivax marinus]|uniref:hypothetical protein n=1 Tax=Roseivivax marinus TaxID=1379903 RepID=UPI00273E89AC|nr:hypothetical protein [Roseivivax marinus]
MASDEKKDVLIQELGRELVELHYQLLEERHACYREYGRLRSLLTSLYERLIDVEAKAQVSAILREMSEDLSGKRVSNMKPNHEGKRAIH